MFCHLDLLGLNTRTTGCFGYILRDKHEVCSALLTNIPQSCIINIKIAERIHFNDSYQKKKMLLCDVTEMLANATEAVSW